MLIEFVVTNFRSFNERQVFSLLPSGKIRERHIAPLKTNKYPKLQVLPTAVLYGANSAGKSNFLRAVHMLEWLVVQSGRFNSDAILVANEFFAFDKKFENKPTCFEIDFIASNQNRYNFIVEFDKNSILKEALYVYNFSKTGKSTINTLYERSRQNIKFSALKGVKESVRFEPNQLFLSRADIEGNLEIKQVYAFFAKHLYMFQMTENEYTQFLTNAYAATAAKDVDGKMTKLIDLVLRESGTGLLGVKTDSVDTSKIQFPDNTPQEVKDHVFDRLKYQINTIHTMFDGEVEIGERLTPLHEESTGTRKLLGLLPLIITSLYDGYTLFIDEMNTSLHTDMTTWLIELFNNPVTNPNGAQLIITTHDIVLLDKMLYDKDQIYIVDKNKYGCSQLYSFADFRWSDIQQNSRSNTRLLDYYETGRLGGVPHIMKPYLEHSISQYIRDAQAEE